MTEHQPAVVVGGDVTSVGAAVVGVLPLLVVVGVVDGVVV